MWRKVREAGKVVGEEFRRATTSARPCRPQAWSSDNADESNVRKVSFSFRVVVVLVPCKEDLRPFSEHLWWGEGDYQFFRHRYDLAVKSATAAAASKQRGGKQRQSQPPRTKGPFASAFFDAASLELEADESTMTRGTKVGTASEREGQALRPPPRLSSRLSPSSPSRSCLINTTKKWTPSAGITAAKAAAAETEEEEGYRTESMSSASDSTWSSGDSSGADSDDEPHLEHREPIFGQDQLMATRCIGSTWAPASDMRLIEKVIGKC